jgi:hypothetical protein
MPWQKSCSTRMISRRARSAAEKLRQRSISARNAFFLAWTHYFRSSAARVVEFLGGHGGSPTRNIGRRDAGCTAAYGLADTRRRLSRAAETKEGRPEGRPAVPAQSGGRPKVGRPAWSVEKIADCATLTGQGLPDPLRLSVRFLTLLRSSVRGRDARATQTPCTPCSCCAPMRSRAAPRTQK